MTADPVAKVTATHEIFRRFNGGELQLDTEFEPPRIEVPGRPEKPRLVHPRDVPRRGLGSEAGQIAFYHAIAHIEFNAINLGLDAVVRFAAQMPLEFSRDWLQVADDEARHFQMLTGHLERFGAAYGDHVAHNNLWEMALRTDFDVMVRMALVPRVLEARGLDVAPGMIDKLRHLGDQQGADVLTVILEEEVEHVSIGNRWFLSLCEQRGLEPHATFRELLREHTRGFLSGPFNDKYRKQAGFSDQELDDLRELEAQFASELG
ncbi:MAG: ferritin-like domain-containing protein [Granulosicoccaceae bacterium]